MVLINRKRIIGWLNSLKYNPHKDIFLWTWRLLPEYDYYENGSQYRAIQFIKKDMSEGRLIFFHSEAGTPTKSQIESAIQYLTTEGIRTRRHIKLK